MNDFLVGYCGIYCGACDHYLSATFSKHLLEGNSVLSSSSCQGCKGTEPEKICKWCRQCHIKECAREKNWYIAVSVIYFLVKKLNILKRA